MAVLYWEHTLIAGSSEHAPEKIHPQRCDGFHVSQLDVSSTELGLVVTGKAFQRRLENIAQCLGGSVLWLWLCAHPQRFLIHRMWLTVGTMVPMCHTKLVSPSSHWLLGTIYLSTAGAHNGAHRQGCVCAGWGEGCLAPLA